MQALRAQVPVSSLVGNRIGTRLSGVYPAIRVTLVGGPPRRVENTAVPDLQVECWGPGADGPSEAVASNAALAVEAAVSKLPGVYTAGTICGASTSGFIFHSPDGTTSRERYIVTVSLLVQP